MTREDRQRLREAAARAGLHLSKLRGELARANPDPELVPTLVVNFQAAAREVSNRAQHEPGSSEVHI
jgi:hypothetical protein